jgi:Tn3 transposase DDE domain
MAMNLPLTGGCLCGSIRYTITEAPQLAYRGHLTICSKLHVKQDWCRSCEDIRAPGGGAVRQLRAQGEIVPDDLLAHIAPLGWEHIGLTGDYVWTVPDREAPFRPLHEPRAMFPALAA